jgi:hypothetical protein
LNAGVRFRFYGSYDFVTTDRVLDAYHFVMKTIQFSIVMVLSIFLAGCETAQQVGSTSWDGRDFAEAAKTTDIILFNGTNAITFRRAMDQGEFFSADVVFGKDDKERYFAASPSGNFGSTKNGTTFGIVMKLTNPPSDANQFPPRCRLAIFIQGHSG